MRKFNTTTVCIPSKHYMVDLTERVKEIKKMIDAGEYFAINRARQYGKTTTLTALKQAIEDEYYVLFLDFQGISNSGFSAEEKFVQEFCRLIWNRKKVDQGLSDSFLNTIEIWKNKKNPDIRLGELFDLLSEWCEQADKGIVVVIDEVDSATNNQVFLDFLSQLRDKYISRDKDGFKTFQSVILSGVTDVKHLKSKIHGAESAKENSPWNVAADFKIDMSLSQDGIEGMLIEYEDDHHTGMDTRLIASMIREYTNGYPFLVSRICQLIDEQFVPDIYPEPSTAWTGDGVEEAVKAIVTEKNTLFDSLMEKLRDYDRLREQMKYLLFRGETIEYLPDNKEQEQLVMYGFIINNHNTVAVSNRIFEMRLYRYFVGESEFAQESRREALKDKPEFIKNGMLDIPLIMDRFISSQKIIRNMNNEQEERKFIEEEGRERFLTYLSPIINGVGTYSVEDETANPSRMDVVIHYNGRRYIIELKIWHGERYNQKGEEQILGYLDRFDLSEGYLLSFSFNKNKTPGVTAVRIGDKLIYEGVV